MRDIPYLARRADWRSITGCCSSQYCCRALGTGRHHTHTSTYIERERGGERGIQVSRLFAAIDLKHLHTKYSSSCACSVYSKRFVQQSDKFMVRSYQNATNPLLHLAVGAAHYVPVSVDPTVVRAPGQGRHDDRHLRSWQQRLPSRRILCGRE